MTLLRVFLLLGIQLHLASGQVSVFISHREPSRRPTGPSAVPFNLTYRLNARTTDGAVVNLPVTFGQGGGDLKTGDLIKTNVAIVVPRAVADELQLPIVGAATPSGRRRLRALLQDPSRSRSLQAQFVDLSNLVAGLAGRYAEVPQAFGQEDLFIVNGQPQDVTSMTFIFQSKACGVVNPITVEAVNRHWYGTADDQPVPATVERYYKTCSYDQLRFPRARNLVLGPIEIPCRGTIGKYKYDLINGNGMNKTKPDLEGELWALRDLALDYVRRTNSSLYDQRGDFGRKILIWPFTTPLAEFSGMANVGCQPKDYDGCVTWLNPSMGDTSPDVMTTFQELGHNVGLAHSTAWQCSDTECWRDEYGDEADPMGGCANEDNQVYVTCVQAPQAYKAGWANPIPGGEFRLESLNSGTHYNYTLPATSLNKTNLLRVITLQDGMPDKATTGQERAIYIAYRVRQRGPGNNFDSGLADWLDRRVWVHEYNDTANQVAADSKRPPFLLTTLSPDSPDELLARRGWGGNSYKYPNPPGAPRGGLKITLAARGPNRAIVTLCRYTTDVESEAESGDGCSNGRDDDCENAFPYF
ncbi:hypothetical protein GPECTOR_40g574 [Gonium pectorale]|uniref:Peptidase M11 gametolysin domain-containing protein n=1 Tax=Gonium pectorale TaxID=33097 RepID=A0A150GBV1_GONPE|nr:hypothetical protein GPECTOR_40g574 [Gonium pectorale]|eukprot:KXZ46840.1 hypothetical protein GPECTOR_40g574 [Gonium pectorale]